MDQKALILESRFSLPPNFLGYCGQKTASGNFRKCIITKDCADVPYEVSKFIVLYPYLKTLSAITGLPELSYTVIESYWFGNDKLSLAKNEHYNLLLDNFLKQGVPDFFVEELRAKQPVSFIPSHLFHVLHIGVGRASGAVPFNLESINNCMIRWGKIIEVKDNSAVVELHSLKIKKSGYDLFMQKEEVPFDRELTPGLKKNYTVAVHWKLIVKKLTADEVSKLNFWTNEVIKIVKPV